jgi:hypothetical protein
VKFFEQQRIVILFEPRSPYADLYSLNALFQEDGRVILEIVGPGFDASDLQRGDITPHEHFVIRADRLGRAVRDPRRLITDYRTTAAAAYKQSVRHRLLKIAEAHGMPLTEEAGTNCLLTAGQTLLLSHLDEYEQLPSDYLEKVIGYLTDLPQHLNEVSANPGDFVVSMSFLAPDARLVFWDVVWPHLKYTPPRDIK